MSGEQGPRPLPPIPDGVPGDVPQIPACAAQLIKFVNPGNPEPTEQEIVKLNSAASQAGRSACRICLEDPKLNILQEGECPAKSLTVAPVFITNARQPHNMAPRHRAVKILRGPPQPPFERNYIPVLDNQVRSLTGLEPRQDDSEEKPTVWQDIGYA